MRLMAARAMGNVRVGSGWLTSLSSHLFYMPYTNMIVFVCPCVCVSFRLALPKPLKTKRIKTQPEQQEEQLTLARCCQLTAFRQLSGTQTHTQTHLVAHMCTYTHTVPCIRKPAGLMHAQVENATKKKATVEYARLLYTH